jgi:dihydroxyacetone kinase-like protein
MLIMDEERTLAHFRQWLLAYADRMVEQEGYLTALDAAIGDGDHGANMVRGMGKVRIWLETDGATCPTVGLLLRTVAMTLISHVGGAAGPLYGAFFLRAAKEAGDQQTIRLLQLAQMFQSGYEGVQQRGKASVGEKTMLDAFHPAIEVLVQAAQTGQSYASALNAAQWAAEQGMRHTIDIQASKGRASYLGARSIGHQDPGATSAYYLFATARQTLG